MLCICCLINKNNSNIADEWRELLQCRIQKFWKEDGAEGNVHVSALSSFIANAHNEIELYAFYRVVKKVSNYQKSSWNRIRNRDKG